MRPAGKGPLDSLYFTYPHFAAKAPPAHKRTRVAIVGAGPVGMTAALTLARFGITCVLLDRKATFNDGSRAICIARASMTILEQIGAVAPFAARALGWRHGRSYYRGQQIYRLEMAHADSEKYLPMYNLQQQYIEQFLHDAIERSPLIDMRWQCDVTDVKAGDDGVTLAIASPAGNWGLECDYVLAADGARSGIRSKLGLRLKGETYEGRYIIADIRMSHDFPTERRAFFEPKGNPGGTVLIHKQIEDIWRIDYQLREDDREEEAMREENIRSRVRAILDDIGHQGPWQLEWWSVYAANTLCLDDYRAGRIFFVGDSAHIVPIFGVRGLNNGLADAFNVGWKLAYVLDGAAAEALLDTYTPERRGATLDVFANATKSTRFMTPPSRGYALAREAVLSLAVNHAFTRDFANPRQMTPYTYAHSALTRDVAQPPGSPTPGAAAPNARLGDGTFLLERCGPGYTVLDCVGGDRDDAASQALDGGLTAIDPRGRCIRVDDRSEAAAVFGVAAGDLVLLRPDLHVAGLWRAHERDALLPFLRACLKGDRS